MNAAMGALRFEGFTLNGLDGVLLTGDKRLMLRPQPLRVLVFLAERSGQLVTNRELIERCWDNPRQTSANSLAQCIKAIRDVLGDADQKVIRTVHGRGYVFAAPVTEVQQSAGTSSPAERSTPTASPLAPPAASQPGPHPGWLHLSRPYYALAAALAAAFVLLAGTWAVWSRAVRPVELTMAALPSVAILPIKAISDDEPERRDADALTNEIEIELLRAPRAYELRIRSAPGYQGSPTHPRSTGRELGVRYLVLGSTRREGDTRLVNIQIVEAESGRPVWGEPFGFKPDERGAQNLAAARIARTVRAEILNAEVRLPLPARPQANHFAMLGRALMSAEGGIETNRKAMEYFDKARALDADSLPALLGYSRTRVNTVLNRWVPQPRYKALLDEAEPKITHAVEIAPTDPAVHVLRCAYLRALGNDREAIAECERAVSLLHNYPIGLGELGRAELETGDTAKAVGHIEEALRLSPSDPQTPAWCYWAGMAEAHAGNYEKALAWLHQSRGSRRGYPNTLIWIAIAYAGLGEWEKAHTYLDQHRANFPKFSLANWKLAMPQSNPAVTAQRQRIEGLLRQLGTPETSADEGAQTGLMR